MPSVTELRRKIRGIRSTRQLTNAMKMVAGARFARAQRDAAASAFYPDELERLLAVFVNSIGDGDHDMSLVQVGDAGAAGPGRFGILAIAADRGLCGDFNGAIVRKAQSMITAETAMVVCVGKKSLFLDKKRVVPNRKEYVDCYSGLTFDLASRIGQDVVDGFRQHKLTKFMVVRQELTGSRARLRADQLLPVHVDPAAALGVKSLYEPEIMEPSEVVEQLLQAKIYTMIRKSYAAELAARMAAMANATRNADMLVDHFTLESNKARQSAITREIAEITGTGEVMRE